MAGDAYGWIPSGVAASTTAYEQLHHVYPLSQANPLGVTGSAKYYSALGRTIARARRRRGEGTLAYLLADHPGSSAEALNGAGNTLRNSDGE